MTSPHLLVKLLLCIWLLICSQKPLLAQFPEIIESIYLEKDNGLKERIVNHTIRDNKGYFYFFSDNYIQRFDGLNFEDVNTNSVYQINESLSNIQNINKSKNHILIQFKSGKKLTINNGSLDFSNNKDNYKESESKYTINPTPKKGLITIEKDNKSYNWEYGKLRIVSASTTKEISISSSGTPKFLRKDKKGNIIVAYTSQTNYVDNYYVLDTADILHDFTNLALEYPTAKDIYTDDAFYKWMICGFNGVKVLTLKRKGIEYIYNRPHVRKGQFGAVVSGLSADDSLVLLTTENGDILEYNPKDNTTTNFNPAYAFISSGLGKMLYDTSKNIHILKGHDDDITDLYFINPTTKSIEHQQIEGQFRDYILVNGRIIMVGQTSSGRGNILIYNPESKEKHRVKIDLPEIRCIYHNAATNEYYLGTKEGLYICDNNFKPKVTLNQNQPKGSHFYHQDILYICTYHDKIIACSNGGGVYIIDPKNLEIIKHLTQKNGFTDAIAISAITDDFNRLWIATFNGLNVLDTTLNIIKTIYEFDGLPSREFNSFSVCKNQGALYFGTINGAVRISPNLVMDWKNSHRIALRNLKTYHNNTVNEIKLDGSYAAVYSPDSLSIHYDLTDYYKYPYNTSMIDVKSENENLCINQRDNNISITPLKKGQTNLFITLESTKYRENLTLDIKTDYGIWKKIALWITSLLIISTFTVYIVSRYIREREKQKTAQNKKISKLQLSALQGQMNPHFIFNALGAIQYFIQTNDVNKADGYLSDFALLMRGILDSSSKTFITLKEELKLLKLYVGLEKARFEDKFDVIYNINENIDEETLIPPMVIQPFIENAINHGLHHLTERKGLLDIRIDYKDDLLIVVIEDNGIGREKAQQLRSSHLHVSRGMSITQERILTINESSEIKISLEIIDLKNDSLKPTGTRVAIYIKD